MTLGNMTREEVIAKLDEKTPKELLNTFIYLYHNFNPVDDTWCMAYEETKKYIVDKLKDAQRFETIRRVLNGDD